ncbi:unnamed protein product, partial [Staurois parvus]
MPPDSAHQCLVNAKYQCLLSCLSVSPISASQYHLSMPVSATISAASQCLSVPVSAAYQCHLTV